MATIKGEIPESLEKQFRKIIFQNTSMKKGSISQALQEAIELWIKYQEQKNKNQVLKDLTVFQGLLDKFTEKFIIVDSETKEILSKGNSIIEVVKEAKSSSKYQGEVKIIARNEINARKAQLGWRLKKRIVGSTSEI